MTARATLPEPVEIAKFFKSRNRAEHVRVDLSEYKGHSLINVRIWQTGTDGIDRQGNSNVGSQAAGAGKRTDKGGSQGDRTRLAPRR
jgi:hypothetical protein